MSMTIRKRFTIISTVWADRFLCVIGVVMGLYAVCFFSREPVSAQMIRDLDDRYIAVEQSEDVTALKTALLKTFEYEKSLQKADKEIFRLSRVLGFVNIVLFGVLFFSCGNWSPSTSSTKGIGGRR